MRKNLLWIIVALILGLLIAYILLTKSCRRSNSSISQPSGNVSTISASALLNQIQGRETKGDLLAVRALYQKLIADFPSSADIMNWQKKLENTNIRLLLSSVITANSTLYQIKPGDSLIKIAQEFKTTPELIQRSNNIPDSMKIFPGKKIKVWTAPFSILVDKSQNILILKIGEEVLKTYVVSTGTNNSTPLGTFKIVNKLPNPTWFKSGAVVPAGSPENILGTRWMGFDLAGYGIHGTTEPQSLGKQATAGCVRMANEEVEELYTIIPVGTEVTVVD